MKKIFYSSENNNKFSLSFIFPVIFILTLLLNLPANILAQSQSLELPILPNSELVPINFANTNCTAPANPCLKTNGWSVQYALSGAKVDEVYNFYKDWLQKNGRQITRDDFSNKAIGDNCYYINGLESSKDNGNDIISVLIEENGVEHNVGKWGLLECSKRCFTTKGGDWAFNLQPSDLNACPSDTLDMTGKTVVGIYHDRHGNSITTATPPPPPPPNTCTLPTEEQRQKEIVVGQIKEKYKIPITDTNLCGKGGDPACGENTPWTFQEVAGMQVLLDDLPACFINHLNLKGITGRLDGQSGSEGKFQEDLKNQCCTKDALAITSFEFGKIGFCGDNYKIKLEGQKTAGGITGVLAHELTHAYQGGDATSKNAYSSPTVHKFMAATGWLSCLPVIGCFPVPSDTATDYGNTNPLEDMAESTRLYYENPNLLKERSLRRYNFVKDQLMCGKEFTK